MIHKLLSIVLSVLYPGLGQLYQGRIVAGYVWIAVHTVGIASIFLTMGFFPFIALGTWIAGIVETAVFLKRADRMPPQEQKKRYVHVGIGIPLAFLLVFLSYNTVVETVFGGPGFFTDDTEQAKEIALRELEDRYGEPFAIVEEGHDNLCLGCEWRYSLKASPAGNGDIVFYTTVSQDMKYLGDAYLKTRWNHELKSTFYDSLNEFDLQKGTFFYETQLFVKEQGTEQLTGDIPLQKILRENPSVLKQDITLYRKGDPTDQAFLRQEWARLQQLFTAYEQDGIEIRFFWLRYFDENTPAGDGQVWNEATVTSDLRSRFEEHVTYRTSLDSEEFSKLKSFEEFQKSVVPVE